jgi:hypothetical protein
MIVGCPLRRSQLVEDRQNLRHPRKLHSQRTGAMQTVRYDWDQRSPGEAQPATRHRKFFLRLSAWQLIHAVSSDGTSDERSPYHIIMQLFEIRCIHLEGINCKTCDALRNSISLPFLHSPANAPSLHDEIWSDERPAAEWGRMLWSRGRKPWYPIVLVAVDLLLGNLLRLRSNETTNTVKIPFLHS